MNKLTAMTNRNLDTSWIDRLEYATANVSDDLNIITMVIVSRKFKNVSDFSMNKQGVINTIHYSADTLGILENYATAIYKALDDLNRL